MWKRKRRRKPTGEGPQLKKRCLFVRRGSKRSLLDPRGKKRGEESLSFRIAKKRGKKIKLTRGGEFESEGGKGDKHLRKNLLNHGLKTKKREKKLGKNEKRRQKANGLLWVI